MNVNDLEGALCSRCGEGTLQLVKDSSSKNPLVPKLRFACSICDSHIDASPVESGLGMIPKRALQRE